MDTQQLNDERKRQNLSVAELAEKANLPKTTVEKVLFGIVKNPRIDTMQAIERALGIEKETPPDELSEGERQLIALIKELTDEEAQELSNYLDFIISKRK